MHRRMVFFVLCTMLTWSLAGCRLVVRTPDLYYEASPEQVIMDADVQPHPGPPEPGTTCRYDSVPMLRIWGDGLVFLDILQYGVTGPTLWSGRLSNGQIHALLVSLQSQGFFSHQWIPEEKNGPNPAGTWFRIGVHLKYTSDVYLSYDLTPAPYQALVDMIKPDLTPFILDNLPDPRFALLHIGTRDCLKNTPTSTIQPKRPPESYPPPEATRTPRGAYP